MKRIAFLLSIALTFTVIGCVKPVIENTKNNPATDFQLKLTRTAPGGAISQQVENALNQPGSAQASAVYFEKGTSVELKIGGIQTSTVVPRLFADIHFSSKANVSEIAGVYRFPEDNYRVEFALNEKVNSLTARASFPASGSLTVTYDPVTKLVSGTITNITYGGVLDNAFVHEVLNGKFSNVGVSK